MGGLRTALFDWLYARHTGGQFILRIEDTDQKRFNPESMEAIYQGLRWLGLEWDEGPDKGGPYAPYVQSERREIYRHYADWLVDNGHAYRCYTTAAELEELRAQGLGYDRRHRNLTPAQRAGFEAAGLPYVIRFAAPLAGQTVIHDVIRGDIVVESASVQDPVLLKSDGMPTYHLAMVVDDHLMQITHVLRGEEWIPSAPLHQELFDAFGWPAPHFVHLPVILDPSGKGKMSKRKTVVDGHEFSPFVHDYMDAGYLPDAMFNFLANMGWSFDPEREIFSREEAIARFEVEDISTKASALPFPKLTWLNGMYIRQLSPAALKSALAPYLARDLNLDPTILAADPRLDGLIPLIQERIKLLTEAAPFVDWAFLPASAITYPDPRQLVGKKLTPAQSLDVLDAGLALLETVEPFDHAELEAAFRSRAEAMQVAVGSFFAPFRVAVTGKMVSPPLFESMIVVGPNRDRGTGAKCAGCAGRVRTRADLTAVVDSPVVETLVHFFLSPIGPALVLLIGAAAELLVGRWVRRPAWLSGVALAFTVAAAILFLGLQFTQIVPTLSSPWQPLLQRAINLYWISEGWNYYISGLILLFGGLAFLLDRPRQPSDAPMVRRHTVLAMNLAVLAASLLFVNSGNLLTALLTWVFLDLTILLRTAAEPVSLRSHNGGIQVRTNEARILSLLGALLLLMGLLPAGATGPAQEFTRGTLPTATLFLMLAASAIRAGVYPLHLWLLPRANTEFNLSERLLDHLAPVLCGLWLFGWTFRLGAAPLMLSAPVLTLLTLSLLASAVAGWTANDHVHHVTFVLITSAGVAVLAGALSHNPGPAGMLWATTAFALGGALWLVGDQVWRAWGWQLPVSVGALALAGIVFTPGFLAQPALANLLISGPSYWPVFVLYVTAQGVQIASLLHSWNGSDETEHEELPQSYRVRLLAACLALGLPLAISGLLPYFTETLTGIPNTIAPMLGNPPSAVAAAPVWVTLGIPLLIGFGLVWLRPRLWPRLHNWPDEISRITQLEWLFRVGMWSIDRLVVVGSNGLQVLEGAGYMGWVLVFLLLSVLLIR